MSNLKQKIEAAQIDLIKELGIDKLEPAQKEKMLTQIGEIIQQRVVLRIVEELPEEKQDEFQAILEKAQEDPDQLDKFLMDNIPGVEDIILAEIGEYKKGATDFMNQALGQTETNEPEIKEEFEEGEKLEVEEVTEKAIETAEPSVEMSEPEAPVEKIESIEAPSEINEPEIFKKTEEEKDLEVGDVIKKTEEAMKSSTEIVEPAVKEEANEGAEEVEEKKPEIKTQPAQSGIEQERADQEAQILEENKVENAQVAGEELDLSNEIGKMVVEEGESKKE